MTDLSSLMIGGMRKLLREVELKEREKRGNLSRKRMTLSIRETI
jgi:hypothetical protein